MEVKGGISSAEAAVLSRRNFLVAAGVAAVGLTEACRSEPPKDRHGEPIEAQVGIRRYEVLEPEDLLQSGSWESMQGARQAPEGLLTLRPTGRTIVNKREDDPHNPTGHRVDQHPPINWHGQHLDVAGDFSLAARVDSDAPVSLWLYGRAPLRFDDFLYYQGPRLECVLGRGFITLRTWDGPSLQPTAEKVMAAAGNGQLPSDRRMEVRCEGDQFKVFSGDKLAGTMNKGASFSQGEVWLGLGSEQGPATVRELTVKPLNDGKVAVVDTGTLQVTQGSPDTLQSKVRKPGFELGSAFNLSAAVSDPRYTQLVLGGEVAILTPENGMKPPDFEPHPGEFNFGEADAIVQFIRRHERKVHFHTLIYPNAAAPWERNLPVETEADKAAARAIFENRLRTVAAHFKGKVASYDVVNEAISGFGQDGSLTQNVWYKAYGGEAYIDTAFRIVREIDANAKLFINDFGLETHPGRRREMLRYVKAARARGVPIDGVGIQGHVNQIPRDTIRQDVLEQLMADFAALGLEVRISELTVVGDKGPSVQADQYANVLASALRARNCHNLTFWVLDDGHGAGVKIEEKTGLLLPDTAQIYDKDMRPKEARFRLVETLQAA